MFAWSPRQSFVSLSRTLADIVHVSAKHRVNSNEKFAHVPVAARRLSKDHLNFLRQTLLFVHAHAAQVNMPRHGKEVLLPNTSQYEIHRNIKNGASRYLSETITLANTVETTPEET